MANNNTISSPISKPLDTLGKEESKEEQNEKDSIEKKEEEINPLEKKDGSPMMVAFPVFMFKPQKYNYNKFTHKKYKQFTERTGDWICKNCRNLNFAFRQECNRCHTPKGETEEINLEAKKDNDKKVETKDKNDELNNKSQIENPCGKTFSSKYNGFTTGYNYYKHKKKYNNYNNGFGYYCGKDSSNKHLNENFKNNEKNI